MSSRALRRLQEGPGVQSLQCSGSTADDDSSPVGPAFGGAKSKNYVNPFKLLNDEDSLSESEVKEDDDVGSERYVEAEKKKQRRKKKNPKRPNVRTDRMKSSEDNSEHMDEVDKSLMEVNALLGEVSGMGLLQADQTTAKARNSLLKIEQKYLNAENEMKRIFGNKVVQQEHHASRHRKNVRNRAHVRASHWLVVPKAVWPHAGKTGLSMKFLQSDQQGNQLFTFVHSLQYQAVQHKFLQAVDSLNPDFIMRIIDENPLHIDSLLQLSDFCKMGEDLQMSSELIERTLYALESSFHPLFNLFTGTCRLDYRKQENRGLFIALFKHLSYVGLRACPRTALELCKLTYSLDPDHDPMGILLVIDHYAVRAQQYAWLISLHEELEPTKKLFLLPNMAYSLSLCYFYQNMIDEADEALQKCLILFPSVLLPLLDKCSVDVDRHCFTHPFFLDAHRSQPNAIQILTSLYVCRSFHMWKDPALLPWLERNAKKVLDRVDQKDKFVMECAEIRSSRYVGLPRNIARHVVLSDIKDATITLPAELSEVAILSYDPLPPVNSIDLYQRRTPPAATINDASALRMFFRSFLPNFNPNERRPAEDAAAAPPQAEEEQRDLRASLASYLDAMHELLQMFHPPAHPNDNDQSSDSDNPEANHD